MGLIVLGMTGVLFVSGAILYIEAVDKNAIFYFEKKYNQIKYDKLYEQGFSLAIYQKKEGADRFTLKNSILPVKLLDISKTHEGISYTFDLYNPTNEHVNVSAYFVVDDHIGYSNELKGLNKKFPQDKSKLKSEEWDEYLKNLKSIYDKYNVEYSLQKIGKTQIPIAGNNSSLIIKPEAHETLKIKRKISKSLKPNEYNMMLDFSIDRDEKDGYLDLIFNPSNSHKKNKIEEIQQNNN